MEGYGLLEGIIKNNNGGERIEEIINVLSDESEIIKKKYKEYDQKYSSFDFNRLDELHANEQKEGAGEYVYKILYELVNAEKYQECDEILAITINKNYNARLLLPFLTVTKFCKESLIHRENLFVCAASTFSKQMSTKECHATIKRLM